MHDRWVSPEWAGSGAKTRNSLVKNVSKGLTLVAGCVREELVGLVTCKKKVYLGKHGRQCESAGREVENQPSGRVELDCTRNLYQRQQGRVKVKDNKRKHQEDYP